MNAQTVAPPRAKSLLEIRDVSKSFALEGRSVDVLRRVCLTVDQGSFVSLVGPSGCGKSTLLRLVAGLDSPDTGAVLLDGQPVSGPGLDRGIVFQDHRLFPWLNVAENVRLGLHKSDLSAADQRAKAARLIELVGLQGFETAKPHQLSGGMAQRAAIARSLAPEPRILLLDEPLGALDSLTRAKLQTELLRIWASQRVTVLMVTHDVEEAVYLSDRVVVMGAGLGNIRHIVDVSLPRPRRRSDTSFHELKDAIFAAVEEPVPLNSGDFGPNHIAGDGI